MTPTTSLSPGLPPPDAEPPRPDVGVHAALDQLGQIHARRRDLVRRRQELQARRARLMKRRGAVWGIATVSKKYRTDLGRIELRDETALVDQYVFLVRELDPESRPVEEDVDVRTQINRDTRLWSLVISGERLLVRKFVQPQARFVEALLEHQRAGLGHLQEWQLGVRHKHPRLGLIVRGAVFLPFLVLNLLVKVQSLIFLNVVKGQQTLADTAVDLPLTVQSSIEQTREEFATQSGRRRLRLALLNERYLTPERRKVLLFLVTALLVTSYLLGEAVLRIFAPGLLSPKQQTDIVFFYAIATRLFLPVPFEPILLNAQEILGIPWAVLVAGIGATAGSWLVFLVGSASNTGFHKIGDKRPRVARFLAWIEDRGRKYAYWMLGIILAIPFSPDSLTAIGGLIKLRLNWFLLMIFISSVVRSILFLLLLG